MSLIKGRLAIIWFLALMFFSILGGLYFSKGLPVNTSVDVKFHGTLLERPTTLEPFSLTGMDQRVFNNQSLKGQWTLFFFGFTHCSYLCPTTLVELAKMHRLLETKKIKPLPKIILISVDAKRDSLEKLKDYVIAFHPNFYAVRGEDGVVSNLAKEMGISYAKALTLKSESSDNYDVQHSGAVILFNPKGELSAFFTTPHQAHLLAEDYESLLRQAKS